MLSDEQINAMTLAQWGEANGAMMAAHRAYARAIEAEVHKKYDEHVLENLDALLDDAAAHIYPSDLKQCQQCECVVEVYSVRVGNPTERSVPLFSREQVVKALRTGGQHADR